MPVISLARRAVHGTILFPPTPGPETPTLDLEREVPQPLLHRIRKVAVAQLRAAVSARADHWALAWEELDPEAALVRRRETLFDQALACELEEGRDGLVLRVDG